MTTQIRFLFSTRDLSTSGIPKRTLSPTAISSIELRDRFSIRSACRCCRPLAAWRCSAARVCCPSQGHSSPSTTGAWHRSQRLAELVDGVPSASCSSSSVCSTAATAGGSLVDGRPIRGGQPNIASYGDLPIPSLTCNNNKKNIVETPITNQRPMHHNCRGQMCFWISLCNDFSKPPSHQ